MAISERMDDVTDLSLRRYLAGALEPPMQALVEAALRADPVLRARLDGLRLNAAPHDPWRLPPPGAAATLGLGASARAGAVMDAAAADYIELRLSVPEEALTHQVLLLSRAPDGWRVIAPESADEVFTAADLPAEPDGARRVDLSLEGDAPWRFGVVLLPPAVAIPWDAPPPERWSDIQARITLGELRVEAVQFG